MQEKAVACSKCFLRAGHGGTQGCVRRVLDDMELCGEDSISDNETKPSDMFTPNAASAITAPLEQPELPQLPGSHTAFKDRYILQQGRSSPARLSTPGVALVLCPSRCLISGNGSEV